jgi:hypothetical protein
MNPFGNTRDMNFSWMGLASDWVPVTPTATGVGTLGNSPLLSPSAGAPNVGIAVRVDTTAGTIVWLTPWGETRTQTLAVGETLRTGIAGIISTSTATGIHVAVVY